LALKDTENLESGLRLKIKNYINRNRVYIDGKWIEKKRVDLEPIVVKKMCADEVTFKELRDAANAYNANNFTLINAKEHNVGNMPADICNALAPLYDAGHLILMDAHVSFVDPITKRNRHAKQAVLFVELHGGTLVLSEWFISCQKVPKQNAAALSYLHL
jgi:hypothetical protein